MFLYFWASKRHIFENLDVFIVPINPDLALYCNIIPDVNIASEKYSMSYEHLNEISYMLFYCLYLCYTNAKCPLNSDYYI